ncbi:TPA: hypothetical protein JGU28_004363 [Salmonella enterica]|nr:hypothetical protein [Salmonella enterica]
MGYSEETNNSLIVKAQLAQQDNVNRLALSMDKGMATFGKQFIDVMGKISDGTERFLFRNFCEAYFPDKGVEGQ